MTDNPFLPKSNDLAVKFVPQTSPTDPRTVLAEEFNLNSSLNISLFTSNRKKQWIEPVTVAPTSVSKKIKITGRIQLEISPQDIVLNHEIIIPDLTGASGDIFRRDDIVTLIGLSAEVGEEQDIVLGKVGFRYENTQTNTIQTIQKENGRRIRSFWLLALNNGVTMNTDFLDILASDVNTGEKLLTIANKNDIGFTVGGMGEIKLYALDENWALKSYKIIAGSVTTTPICSLTRFQNYRENGYIYGLNGEEPFSELSLNDISENFANGEQIDITAQIKKAVREIASGEKRKGSRRKKAILNFINGQAGNNPNNPGIAAIGLNGTYCLGNDQRIQFTNQKSINKLFVSRIQTTDNGSGNAVAGIGLNTNAPLGSYFSENREDHKIYSLDGVEQSALGKFSNLGGNNSLTWTAQNNSTISPGQYLLFVPGIRYPSGSGMSIPYSYISKAWKDGSVISPGNIRFGMDNDLDAYESPVNNESFIVIYGSERAAIHYIYKKISVVSSANGTLILPSTEKGCFAFINGINGRLDTPVVTGLTSSTNYNALCYYPPRSTETWQFELIYTDYQGKTAQAAFLDNAIICSEPICFFHTSGGGLSVHKGDVKLAASTISLHLPAIESVVKGYEFDSPISFPDEPYENPISWKENVKIFSAANLIYPAPGQKIAFTAPPGNSTLPKSVSGILKSGGKTLGLKVPPISGGNSFQAVIAFAVEKARKRMLVIATKNCIGNTPIEIALDSSQTAFDLFEI